QHDVVRMQHGVDALDDVAGVGRRRPWAGRTGRGKDLGFHGEISPFVVLGGASLGCMASYVEWQPAGLHAARRNAQRCMRIAIDEFNRRLAWSLQYRKTPHL